MFLTVLISVLITLYILLCIGLYSFHYLVEVILDLPITGQSPCSAHAALKQLIERLLREAVNLPLLEKAHAHPTTTSDDTTNKNYEDLLATAIINKVVSSCQNNLPSSSANSVSSKVSTSSRGKDDKEYFFGEETLDRKWKITDLDTTSVSSLEDWMQSESSFGSRKYVDKVTLMIKQDIEEVDNSDSDNEHEDEAEYFRSSSSLYNDNESNWFLQKRNFQGAHSPVPVPMLVPNPTSDVKVLIGDKPLDDTSDLSDVESDYEEPEPAHAAHALLLQSKDIIGGGKSSFEIIENGDEHSESSTDSGVKEVNGKEQKSFDISESVKTDITVDDDNVEDSSFLSIYSNTEKEAEYTERYGSLPEKIIKTSPPNSNYIDVESANRYDKPEQYSESHQYNGDSEYVGSYSKKEKEKWKHAIEMKNNPYSKENIEKRIKRSHSASSALFGPDYYAKLAKKPSGGEKLTSNEINGVNWPPLETPRSRTPSPVPELPKAPPPLRQSVETTLTHSLELNISSTPIDSFEIEFNRPPELPKTGPPPKSSIEIDGIHQAIQAIVTPFDKKMPDNSFESQFDVIVPEKRPQLYKRGNYTVQTNSPELTSDSDLSYVNFYDVEHSQIVRKSKNEDIHIPITATPLGVSYKSIADENDNRNEEINYNQKITTSILYVEDKTDVVSKETPVAKPRVFALQTKTEHIQREADHVETQIEHVKTRAEHIQAAHSQTKSQNGLYIKATTADKHKHLTTSASERPVLRRNLSETSLLEQSFDNAPKVLHQKKDNTLISKIYKDPKVRLFALHSRDGTGTDSEYAKTAYRSQLSYDSKITPTENSHVYLNKGRSYNSSDDGLTSEYESGKTGKMSFFSSEEDLLSINSEDGFKHNNVISTKSKGVEIKSVEPKSNGDHVASSLNYAITPRSTNLNKKFIFGSQEDLLSIEEVEAIPKRKDNTIISKIYKHANVRNFALQTHGDNIPYYKTTVVKTQKSHNASSSDEELVYNNTKVQKQTVTQKKMYSSYDDLLSADISLEANLNHTINQNSAISHSNTYIKKIDSKNGYKSEDMDIEEVAKRHVVQDTLGKFSRSEINVKSCFVRSTSMDESDGVRISVRDLKKKFESKDTGTKPVISSLTARSLSKQVKDSLKQ